MTKPSFYLTRLHFWFSPDVLRGLTLLTAQGINMEAQSWGVQHSDLQNPRCDPRRTKNPCLSQAHLMEEVPWYKDAPSETSHWSPADLSSTKPEDASVPEPTSFAATQPHHSLQNLTSLHSSPLQSSSWPPKVWCLHMTQSRGGEHSQVLLESHLPLAVAGMFNGWRWWETGSIAISGRPQVPGSSNTLEWKGRLGVWRTSGGGLCSLKKYFLCMFICCQINKEISF